MATTPTDEPGPLLPTETQPIGPWPAVIKDIHIRIPGIIIFCIVAVGIIWPQYKDRMAELRDAAEAYLLAAAIKK